MELVGQCRRLFVPSIVSIRFPWFVSITLFVLIGIAVVVIGVITATRRELSNPFSAFSDLFGSEARQAAVAHGFTCQKTELRSHTQSTSDDCVRRFTDKTFSAVYLSLSGNLGNEISFSLRENTLTLGDLAVLWGKPEIWLYCEAVVAAWPARHSMGLVISPRSKRITYFLPVISISFTRGGQPHWKQVLMNDALHNCGGVRKDSLGSYSS